MIYFVYEILILWLLVFRRAWKGGYQLLEGQATPLIVSVIVAGSAVSLYLFICLCDYFSITLDVCFAKIMLEENT